jgi:Putative DNA-binding domain
LFGLLPKQHLESIGITGAARTNQIANMAFVDWADNTAISSKEPSLYWPEMSAHLSSERLKAHRYWHALPVGWEQLSYEDFLDKRRRLIARVVRDAFQTLRPTSPSVASRAAAATTTSELIAAGESINVEFKSSARWSSKGQVRDPKLEHVIVKTIAGFMNAEGGTLLIGVDDKGQVVGLEADYQTLGKQNRDGYEPFLAQLLDTNLSGAALAWLGSPSARSAARRSAGSTSLPARNRCSSGPSTAGSPPSLGPRRQQHPPAGRYRHGAVPARALGLRGLPADRAGRTTAGCVA